jgi:hypothetical protein
MPAGLAAVTAAPAAAAGGSSATGWTAGSILGVLALVLLLLALALLLLTSERGLHHSITMGERAPGHTKRPASVSIARAASLREANATRPQPCVQSIRQAHRYPQHVRLGVIYAGCFDSV